MMPHRFHPVFEQKMPELVRLLKAHRVVRAYAFGSVLTDHFTENSDVDLIVSFEEGLDQVENGELLWSLWYQLRDLFQRNVDLLTERSVKNPYFKEELLENRSPVLWYYRFPQVSDPWL